MAAMVKEVERTLPVGYAVFARSAIGLVLSFLLLRRAALRWQGNRPGLLALRGLVGFSALMCTFESISRIDLSDAVVLHQTQPIWTAILARLFLGERARRRIILATLVALTGVVLVVRPSFLFGADHAHTLDPVGVALALSAALLSAGGYVSVRALRKTDEPLVVVFWFAFVATPASLPSLLADVRWPTGGELLLLFGIGLAVQGAQMLMTRALHREPAGRVAAVGYLQVVYASVLGALLFGEVPRPLGIVGALLVIGGALLATLEPGARAGAGRAHEHGVGRRDEHLDTPGSVG
jgi:drug/metabolite transporter (DMT)-like permease